VRKKLGSRLADRAELPENVPPFERFRHLTKRLVSVPKAEVDAIRAEEERAKPERPSRSAAPK